MQIKVDACGLKGKELEAVVEADIKRFNEYFTSLSTPVAKNDPLDKYEVSILKTYLFFKCVVEPGLALPPPTSPGGQGG